MATAIEYGLITALAAVVIITGVTALDTSSEQKDKMSSDAARAEVFQRAQNAAAAGTVRLNQSFQQCGVTYCETGIVTKLPSSKEAGSLDIVDSGPEVKGRVPFYAVSQAQTYRIFAQPA